MTTTTQAEAILQKGLSAIIEAGRMSTESRARYMAEIAANTLARARPGCYFHGGGSGHSDTDCDSTFYNPILHNWCRCEDQEQVRAEQQFYVSERRVGYPGHDKDCWNQDYACQHHDVSHGWYHPQCHGITQTG